MEISFVLHLEYGQARRIGGKDEDEKSQGTKQSGKVARSTGIELSKYVPGHYRVLWRTELIIMKADRNTPACHIPERRTGLATHCC